MDLQYNSAMILLSIFMGTMTELCGKGTEVCILTVVEITKLHKALPTYTSVYLIIHE